MAEWSKAPVLDSIVYKIASSNQARGSYFFHVCGLFFYFYICLYIFSKTILSPFRNDYWILGARWVDLHGFVSIKTTVDLHIFLIEYRAVQSWFIIIYEPQCHVWTFQYSFRNGGSKKYRVFICWSKLNEVGYQVNWFSWPSGLRRCFGLQTALMAWVQIPAGSITFYLYNYHSIYENNFNKFAFGVINLEKYHFETCFDIHHNILEPFYGFPTILIYTFFKETLTMKCIITFVVVE